jgi:hypothetical protein
MINIYKLKYASRQEAIDDLIDKGILIITEEGTVFGNEIHAVVEIPKIVNTEAVFNENGDQIVDPTFIDGYHVDIMSSINLSFGSFEVFPATPKHKFLSI